MAKKKISLPVVFLYDKRRKPKLKGTPPCIRIQASYMAELAIALPFFTGFMVSLLFFFQVLTVQQEVGNALLSTGRELSVLSCRDGEIIGSSLTAQALFWKNMKKSSEADSFVHGRKMGILLKNSNFTGDFIYLQADYAMRLPIGLFGKKEISLTQKLKCRKWIGENCSGLDRVVYMTPNGTVYHTKLDCTHIKLSVKEASSDSIKKLRNDSGGKYYPCESCMKNEKTDNMSVYITTYGNRYHKEKSCSKIKRNAYAIHLSEIKGTKACSKCGKE